MRAEPKNIIITNPQQVACGYYWLPGLTLQAGATLKLDYDPRERVAGVRRTQLMHDLEANLVRIEHAPDVKVPDDLPSDGPIAQMLREQPVQRDDSPGIQQPQTINLNDKLGWKPLQTSIQSETPAINLEEARTKTIGDNAKVMNAEFPFGMPPEIVKAQHLANKAVEKKAIEDAAIARHLAEVAPVAVPKRKRRTKAEIAADKAAKEAAKDVQP